ncbi:MAG: hypothetical protein Q7U51_14305, partial [Methanoregula sp.]|nr:hypothetical protein [Methanoregula sp.]
VTILFILFWAAKSRFLKMGFDLEESGGGKNRGSDQNFSIWGEYIAHHTSDGIYRIPGRMGVLWWKVE